MPQIIANSTATTPPSGLNRLNQTGALSRLSSGQKSIERGADTAAAAGPSSSVSISSAAQTLATNENNKAAANKVLSIAGTAQDAVVSTSSKLVDLETLADKAASSPDQRANLAAQAKEILGAIDTTVAATQSLDGQSMLDGNFSVTVTSEASQGGYSATIKIGDLSSKGLGLDGMDFSTEEGAQAAISTIRQASLKVRSEYESIVGIRDSAKNAVKIADDNIANAQASAQSGGYGFLGGANNGTLQLLRG